MASFTIKLSRDLSFHWWVWSGGYIPSSLLHGFKDLANAQWRMRNLLLTILKAFCRANTLIAKFVLCLISLLSFETLQSSQTIADQSSNSNQCELLADNKRQWEDRPDVHKGSLICLICDFPDRNINSSLQAFACAVLCHHSHDHVWTLCTLILQVPGSNIAETVVDHHGLGHLWHLQVGIVRLL